MLTSPNTITLLRLAAVPFIAFFSCRSGILGPALGSGLFAAAAASDWLDGHLARVTGAQSRLGAVLDPLVDKAMVLTVLFVFWDLGLLPLWLVLLNLLREAMVTVLRYARSTPQAVVGANWMGKAKFCLQVAVIEAAYLHVLLSRLGKAFPWGDEVVFWALLAVTVVSFGFLAQFALGCRTVPGQAAPASARHAPHDTQAR